jgi:hypothetical protein
MLFFVGRPVVTLSTRDDIGFTGRPDPSQIRFFDKRLMTARIYRSALVVRAMHGPAKDTSEDKRFNSHR